MAEPTVSISNELTIEGLKGSLTQLGYSDSVGVLQDDNGQDSFIAISPPGISVKDIRTFLKATLADIGDVWDIIPESLPVDGVRLSSFRFCPKADGYPFQLEFTIDWPSAHWEMIPGILAFASPSVEMYITGKADEYDTVRVSGAVSGVVEIEKTPVFIEVELPNGTFKAELLKGDDYAKHSAGALFQKFQVGSTQQNTKDDKGIDLGALTIEDLVVLGSIPARRLLFHLALGHISIGPGDMAVQMTIDYFGGENSQLSGQVWGQYDIHKKNTQDTLFSLMLSAAYDGPGKNWKFEGGAAGSGVSIADIIGAFTDTGGVPGILNQIVIRYLHLSYETGPGNFEFQCDVEVKELFGKDAEVEMIVEVRLQKTAAGYQKTFSGRLLFRMENDLTLEFDLLFDQSPNGKASDTTFIAAYKNPTGGDINIGDLIQKIDPALDVPLSIKLQDAFFIYNKQSTPAPGRSASLFGLDIGAGIDLSALPLIGKVLPKEASLTFGLQPRVAIGTPDPTSQAYFSEAELARLSALIPGGGITLPAREIKEQIGLGINIAIGKDLTFHFDLPIVMKSQVQPKTPSANPLPATDATIAPAPTTPVALNPPAKEAINTTGGNMTTSPATQGATPAPAGSSASGIQWINVQKTFGPVQFNRIGLQFESDKKMVWAYLDAGLSVGPLTFTLDGLGMGTPINKLEPEFRLLGIGIDYKSGPVEIGASFLRSTSKLADGTQYDEYSGMATIKTPTIGLSAIGSYAVLPNYKSLFIFAALNAPIGGPAFFFVTGLAAGFGFNRAVKAPDISMVGEFPLVNMAVGGAGSPVPKDPGGRANYIHDILDKLSDSIYPMEGQYFLAAGIRFSSFQLIDSFVLLMVSFGKHFEVNVLGLSTAVIPTPIPGGPIVTPLAEIQLAIKAVFNPGEGFLGVQAQLTNNSFILDRNCHLTGGFAFFTWFSGPHEGDFVISVGGYHPDFKKPAHYPDVPRLGLNWQVTSELSIKGGIYFALCPHALMAGGRLEATYQSGSIKAWFILGVDFIMGWKPFYYDAKAYLDIGVEYTYHFAGAHHISVHLNADVHVWGPDFAGHAHVSLWCVTFDIDFGAKSLPKVNPLAWSEFQQSFLPKETQKMAVLTVTDGLIKSVQLEDGRELHCINPQAFQLAVNLAVPVKEVSVADTKLSTSKLHTSVSRQETVIGAFTKNGSNYAQQETPDTLSPAGFGIAPMGMDNSRVQSKINFIAERYNSDTKRWDDVSDDFGYRPVLKQMPSALWGERLQVNLNGKRAIENVMGGLQIIPATSPAPGATHWVRKADLQYTTTHVEPGIGFENMLPFDAVDLGGATLKDHLIKDDTAKARRDILEALGMDYNRLGMNLTPDIADLLIMEPQVGQLVG